MAAATLNASTSLGAEEEAVKEIERDATVMSDQGMALVDLECCHHGSAILLELVGASGVPLTNLLQLVAQPVQVPPSIHHYLPLTSRIEFCLDNGEKNPG